METFSALLALCAGNSPVPVNSPHKGQWRGALMFFFYLRLNKRLSKQPWGWWFETPSWSLWRQCNDTSYFLIWDKLWCVYCEYLGKYWAVPRHQSAVMETHMPGCQVLLSFSLFKHYLLLKLHFCYWNFGQTTEIRLNFLVVSARKYWNVCRIMQNYLNYCNLLLKWVPEVGIPVYVIVRVVILFNSTRMLLARNNCIWQRRLTELYSQPWTADGQWHQCAKSLNWGLLRPMTPAGSIIPCFVVVTWGLLPGYNIWCPSHLAKSHFVITYFSDSQPFWNFAQSTAVSLPCPVQNFKTIE